MGKDIGFRLTSPDKRQSQAREFNQRNVSVRSPIRSGRSIRNQLACIHRFVEHHVPAKAIDEKLLTARAIASDETTTRINGVTQWQWVFLSDQAVRHKVTPRRTRSVAKEVLGSHHPDVWVSDRYAGQQELGKDHQVCLAHVLRDVQYAIDCGDTIFAPKIRDHLR